MDLCRFLKRSDVVLRVSVFLAAVKCKPNGLAEIICDVVDLRYDRHQYHGCGRDSFLDSNYFNSDVVSCSFFFSSSFVGY